MAKKRKQQSLPWCWFCDREFENEKILIDHQKAKHFKCLYCHKKLNSGSGLVIHIAQLHGETIYRIPNAVEGHDTPEVEVYGMDGVPEEDLKRHREGLPMVPYKKSRLADQGASMLPLLAAQKAAVPDAPAESLVDSGTAMAPVPPAIISPPLNSVSPTVEPVAEKKESSGIVSAAAVSYTSHPYPYPYHPHSPPFYPPPPGYGVPAPPTYGYPPQYPYPPYPPAYPPNQYSYPPPYYNPAAGSFTSPYTAYPPTPYAGNGQILGQPSASPSNSLASPVTPQEIVKGEGTKSFIKIDPITDEQSGKTIHGAYIMVEDLEISIEEKRAALSKYKQKI